MTEPEKTSTDDQIPSALRMDSAFPRAVAVAGRHAPLVWLIPVLAAFIAAGIGVRDLRRQGPTILITFQDAEGIEAEKTKIRYKSVNVGTVKEVNIGPDRHSVIVSIAMAKSATDLLVADTRFWLVKPRLGATGISGLSTLLSGVYIGLDAGNANEDRREFVALKAPPVVAGDVPGTRFMLSSDDAGSLDTGAPVYFRRLEVGHIVSVSLDSAGRSVDLGVFIESPYDRLVTDDTRFWNASGMDVSIDAAGVRLHTESLTTVLAGGIAFEAPPTSLDLTPAKNESRFRLASTRAEAMKTADGLVERYVLYFDQSLRGLSPGAIVDFRGVEIGEVVSIGINYDRMHERFEFPVVVNVYPERIRARYQSRDSQPLRQAHDLVAQMINQGFRAQLRTSSLLSGQLYIALDFFPDAARAIPQPRLTPMPLPTIRGDFLEIQSKLVSMANKINELPLAKLTQDADGALIALQNTLGDARGVLGTINQSVLPPAHDALLQAAGTLDAVHAAITPEARLPSDLHVALGSITRAADSLRILTEYLEQHPDSVLRGKQKDAP